MYPRPGGITFAVTTFEDDDELLAEQEGKAYGEDEGERDPALDDDAAEEADGG